MTNLHKPIIAFLAFKELAAPEARRKFAERALEFKSKASPVARNNLIRRIDRTLSVDGFQHASKAPPARILQQLPAAASNLPRLFEAVLTVWRESHAELEMLVTEFLDNLETPFETVIEGDGQRFTALSEEIRSAISAISEKSSQTSSLKSPRKNLSAKTGRNSLRKAESGKRGGRSGDCALCRAAIVAVCPNRSDRSATRACRFVAAIR